MSLAERTNDTEVERLAGIGPGHLTAGPTDGDRSDQSDVAIRDFVDVRVVPVQVSTDVGTIV